MNTLTVQLPESLTKTIETLAAILVLWVLVAFADAKAAPLTPVVEIEENVYSFKPADNGAGPMWCHGSTCLVRVGGDVFASGIETIPDAQPLHNCRWMLFQHSASTPIAASPPMASPGS